MIYAYILLFINFADKKLARCVYDLLIRWFHEYFDTTNLQN